MSFDLAIDLGQAAVPSLTCTSILSASGISASITTDAAQEEPAGYLNGVTGSTPPFSNSFTIHSCTPGESYTKRNVFIMVTTQTPFVLKQLKILVNSDAFEPGSMDSVDVEVSVTPDIKSSNRQVIGLVKTHLSSPTANTLTTNVQFPTGNTYICLNCIKGNIGSEGWIAYSDIKLSGTGIAGAVTTESEPVNPDSRAAVSDQTVAIQYDFSRGALNAKLVSPTDNIINNLVSYLSTNTPTPGNGVAHTKLNLAENVFMVRNAGPQVPWVLQYVYAVFTSDSGHPKHYAKVAVEAAPTLDFRDASILCALTTEAFSHPTAALLPRGLTYIRLRATDTTEATNYIAFEKVRLGGLTTASDWVVLAEYSMQVVTYRNTLISVNSIDGSVWRYNGLPNDLTQIGNYGAQIVGSESGLYALSVAKDRITSWDTRTKTWILVGGPMRSLFVAPHTLYGMADEGYVWRYDPISNNPNFNWVFVGGPFRSAVANDSFCIGISPDGQSVQMCQSGTTSWTTIGGAMSSLVTSNNALYGVDSDGKAWRYSGRGTLWTALGGPFKQLVVQGLTLLAITTDGLAVMKLVSASPLVWTQYGPPLDSISASNECVVGTREGKVYLAPLRHLRSATPLRSSSPKLIDPPVVAPADTADNWLLHVHTKDVSLAGYDGNVTMRLNFTRPFDGDTSLDVILPVTHFERNGAVMIPVALGSQSGILNKVSLQGSKHFWPDHWVIDHIVAWDLDNHMMYDFKDFGAGEVPNFYPDNPAGDPDTGMEWLELVPATKTYLSVSPTYARVFVWPARAGEAAGHASIMLSDNTYISWWPSKINSAQIPYFEGDWSGDAYNDRTYPQDVADEFGLPPGQVIRIYNLDEAAVKAWWETFNVAGARWTLYNQNCAKIVYMALLKGGVLPERTKQEAAEILTWTPWELETLAICISVQDFQSWNYYSLHHEL
ncbi:hypothetical protein LTR56_004065 [Elasticomyces elasticus]|nr:hypothetical protein LTR56_004065 [Elasticomyces elasticus]KAK3661372.1 hypothetical protein LTR22_007579 [Elasticomyces elasticus]KAK4928933.1 hypothetical protein LTR49_004434 [Elasticomyces elasticus]KAK5765401.1 hypothetical protein LTS12_004414 [Elasticomyces elasticus]